MPWRRAARLVQQKWRLRRRRIVSILLVLAGLCAVVVGIGWMLVRAEPLWWRAIDPADPALAPLATAVENDAVSAAHRLRDHGAGGSQEEWTVTIDAAAATAWLNARMPRWAVSQGLMETWPEPIREVQASFDGGVNLGARVAVDGSSQVLWVHLTVSVDEAGRLVLEPGWVRLGRLPVPTMLAARVAVSKFRDRGGSAANPSPDGAGSVGGAKGAGAAVIDSLASGKPFSIDPTVRLADGRRVRVVEVRTLDGLLYITCRTDGAAGRGP